MPNPQNAIAAPVAYVATGNPNAVLVLDTATNHILDSVALGDLSAVADLAVSPDGKRAYITASEDGPHGGPQGALHVVDTATNKVLTSINNIRAPGAVALSPDGKRAYVATNDSLQVIDTAGNTVLSSIGFELPPKDVATDGKRLYVTVTTESPAVTNLRVIDADTSATLSTQTINANVGGIALTPDGSRLYLSTTESGGIGIGIQVLNTATNALTGAETHEGCCGIVVAPDGKRAYYLFGSRSDAEPLTLGTIDTATNKDVEEVELGLGSFEGAFSVGMAITPDGKAVYVANTDANKVSVVDTALNKVTAEVEIGGAIPGAIAIFARQP